MYRSRCKGHIKLSERGKNDFYNSNVQGIVIEQYFFPLSFLSCQCGIDLEQCVELSSRRLSSQTTEEIYITSSVCSETTRQILLITEKINKK